MVDQQLSLQIAPGMSVMIGIPLGGASIPLHTALSLIDTAHILHQQGISVAITSRSGAHVISRDALVDDFLRSGEQRLLWIDSDMVWKPEDVLRLLALSCQPGVDVIGCAYRAKVEGDAQYYVNADADQATSHLGLFSVKGMGLGFTLCSREAMQRIYDSKPEVTDQISGDKMRAVFRFDVHDGHRRTEDMAFFADLIDLGYTVWLDPHVELGHIGPREWRGRILDTLVKTE